jgi:YesN/AraC family two-component response regulator
MAIKVLVVDDEPDVAVIFRQKFRKRMAAGEIEFLFAENGRLALNALVADPEISLVFTDIRMPTMDGLTFLKEVKALDRQVLLSLVVSAYDDMPNIREAMRQGAWDFVTKPIDLDDLERVLNHALGEVHVKLAAIATAERLLVSEQERWLTQRSKELQREFFENVTHEFRTPLTLLLAPLESALGLSSEPQVVDYLRQAKRSGLILLDLVNELLEFAKVDAKGLQPQRNLLDISELLETICGFFVPIAQQKHIQLHTTIAQGIYGASDRRMLGRILLNLLSNAFKFTPSDGQINCELGTTATGIFILVQDTGVGMNIVGNYNVFERFQSASTHTNGIYGSSGLGLSICKSLVELLGGTIQLEQQAGYATTFRIDIPLEIVSADPIHAQDDGSEELIPQALHAFHPADAQSDTDNEKELILIVEDHPDMRRYLQQILQDDYQVLTAENGRIGWEKAQELIPDLILTDWMMPEMSGIELLECVRVNRDTHHIPVVMLTAKADLETKLQGIASGSEAFLAKPFHPEELKAVLHGLLTQRERMRDRFRTEMLHPDKIATTSLEDHFLADIKRVMEKHLMDEQFGVETMADTLAMSRRTLVRKLTAVTGQAPVKFIRAYRLERALQMLRDNTAPIWEIAVKTGFGSASYFTKCFKDHYGISPREAIHSH